MPGAKRWTDEELKFVAKKYAEEKEPKSTMKEIAAMVNKEFYGGNIRTAKSIHNGVRKAYDKGFLPYIKEETKEEK